jgi:hypothetical protein
VFNKVIQTYIDVTWLLIKEIEGVSQGDNFNDGKDIHDIIFLLGMETHARYYYFSCLVKEKGWNMLGFEFFYYVHLI